jgi:mannose-1-phosphate guanylyltransferase
MIVLFLNLYKCFYNPKIFKVIPSYLSKMNLKAVILAGGLGERLRPLTDKIPKPLLPVKGKPIMQYAIENLKKADITDITLGISYYADKIKTYFKDGKKLGVRLSYSIEKEPLGTGGAVRQASHGNKEPFILQWGDNLMDTDYKEMVRTHKRNKAQVTIALTPREDVEHFGVAKLDGEKIVTFVEKPKREDAPSNLINAGAFIINPDALNILPEGKSSIERDCFEKLAPLGVVYAYKHKGQWFPTDTLEKYEKAKKEWKP